MLTALTVKNVIAKNCIGRIFNTIRGNSINIEIKSARGVVLRDIVYINRNGKINWYALDSEIGAQRNQLLCTDNIIFPKNSGYKRFENIEFKIQLACNLGVYVLSKLKSEIPGVKVGVFDKNACCTNLLEDLISYSADIVVVTDYKDEYEKTAEKIAFSEGALVSVSENRDALSDCPLVIAPAQINESLPVSGGAIVLTSFAPTVCVTGLVYFDYHFRMPNMFDKIKPESLSCEYFAGALYTKGRQYELGSIVPTTCSNFSSSQTPRSICDYLIRLCGE